MGLFGEKWQIVKTSGDKVILSDNRIIAVVSIEGNKIDYDKRRYRLPGYALQKVQNIVDERIRSQRNNVAY